MSLLATLPAPRQQQAAPPSASVVAPVSNALATVGSGREAPPYPRRKGFVPRRQEDFKDGGAYPELPLLQYPLDMGRPDEQRGKQTLAVAVDIEGNANYDAVLRQGARADKVIHTGHQALIPKVDLMDPQALARPDEEEVERTAKETMEALNRRVSNKLAVQNPSTLPAQPGAPTYIKYTPSQQGAAYASGAKQRIIKLQDMPVDPLEPPKFRHTKVPRGAGSPPVPVMHSPPRPVTAEDQANWKIPPCISNWKNAKGYTIPLDKRLAADGRGLQEQTISDKFASMSEALQVAEAKARESTEMRKQVALEMARRQKLAKDEQLRKLAQQARMERGGPLAAAAGGGLAGRDTAAVGGAPMGGYPGPPPAGGTDGGGGGGHSPSSSGEDERRHGGRRSGGRRDDEHERRGRDEFEETAQEREERRRRDDIREERRRERERERRLEARDGGGPTKKSKVTRDRERDIGEKVALGMANVGATGEVQYDTRLFNQEQGMGSGFGAEDNYNLYDKPLFASRDSNLFRPVRGQDDELHGGEGGGDRDGGVRTDRFKADRGFAGAAGEAGGAAAPGGAKRGGGVEYESTGQEADPFGLEQFMEKVDRGRRPLDGIGQRGGMAAGAGGGGDAGGGGGGGRRMEFTSGSSGRR